MKQKSAKRKQNKNYGGGTKHKTQFIDWLPIPSDVFLVFWFGIVATSVDNSIGLIVMRDKQQ